VAPSASWVVFVFVVLSPLYSFWLLLFNKISQWGPPLLYFSLKKSSSVYMLKLIFVIIVYYNMARREA